MKITALQQNGTWESQYGLMYRMEVTLEDGTTGEVSAKKQDAWKVGDDVEIESKSTNNYGTRLKLRRPEFNKGGSGAFGGVKNEETQRRIDASWAVGQSLAILSPICAQKDGAPPTMGETKKLALQILELRNELVKSLSDGNS